MTDFTVRSMEQRDLGAVGTLAGRLVRMHYEWDRLRFLTPVDPEEGYRRWFATQLDVEETMLLVAEDAEGVCGYVYARLEPRSYNDLLDACAWLHDILVDERARRRGIGEALVKETFARAKAKGAPRVVLLTAVQNAGAQRLFARCGFRNTMLEMTAELA
ncbi:MAG: GNAT family N-acetyltransferase [Labilithrix sp.]|nr:GNAT family N-acetyltransferase [Labilithrix sp.]MCW5816002.1 GNAT family N-acetyltransferase [Labilithrix sp.]